MLWVDKEDPKVLVMNVKVIDAGSTSYSTVIGQCNQTGFAAVLLTSTATGTFAITMQASVDGANFYNPIDQNAQLIGQVLTTASALITLTNYIQFSPVLAPYTRLAVTPTQGNTVSIDYLSQGDR